MVYSPIGETTNLCKLLDHIRQLEFCLTSFLVGENRDKANLCIAISDILILIFRGKGKKSFWVGKNPLAPLTVDVARINPSVEQEPTASLRTDVCLLYNSKLLKEFALNFARAHHEV